MEFGSVPHEHGDLIRKAVSLNNPVKYKGEQATLPTFCVRVERLELPTTTAQQ